MSEHDPNGPNFDRPDLHVERGRSSVDFFDVEGILSDANISAVIIYDRADYQTPIERTKVSVEAANGGYDLSATIALDRSRTDMAKLIEKFKDGFKSISTRGRTEED